MSDYLKNFHEPIEVVIDFKAINFPQVEEKFDDDYSEKKEFLTKGKTSKQKSRYQILDADTFVPSAKKQKGSVRFSTINIRHYPIVLGDHPECSCGLPLSLGWIYKAGKEITIDTYENHRPPRRCTSELIMPFHLRKKIIAANCCYNEDEIRGIKCEIRKIKDERKRTIARLRFSKIEELLESSRRKIKRIRGLGVMKEFNNIQ